MNNTKDLAGFFNELEATAKDVEKIGEQANIKSDALGLASVLVAIKLMCEK